MVNVFNLDRNIYLRPKENTPLTFVGKTSQTDYKLFESVLQSYSVIFSLTDPLDVL